MSVHRFVLDVEVDDGRHDALSAPRGQRGLPAEVRWWNASDLFRARVLEAVDPGKCVIEYKGRVSEDAS